MNKKLQIFISSTYLDLIEERQVVVEAILQCRHIPAGMELFSANNKKQFDVIKKWIRESDIVFLILGGRYGSIELNSKKSYIELEYDYAKKIGKKPIAFIMSQKGINDKLKNEKYQLDNLDLKLREYEEFKNRIIEHRMCDFFSNSDELRSKVFQAIRTCEEDIATYKGWVSGDILPELLNRQIATYHAFDLDSMLLSARKGSSVYITGITVNSVWSKKNIFKKLLDNGVILNILVEKDDELLSKMCDFFYNVHKGNEKFEYNEKEVQQSIYNLSQLNNFDEYYKNGLINVRRVTSIITTSCIGVDIDKDCGQIQAVFYQYGTMTEECPAVMLKCSDVIGKTIGMATINMWNDGIPIELM